MRERYWFRAQKQGIGWVPATWQGWWVSFFYLIALVYSFFQIDGSSHSTSDTLINFLPRFFLFSALLIIITYLKGEPLNLNTKKKQSD